MALDAFADTVRNPADMGIGVIEWQQLQNL